MSIDAEVWECLERAIVRFNSGNDRQSLLGGGVNRNVTAAQEGAVSERCIVYRLAFYLESELRKLGIVRDEGPIAVDCEYNRHISGPKSLAASTEDRILRIVHEARRRVRQEGDHNELYAFSVAPDLIVHERRSDDRNLLVVEVKKRSNPETPEYDQLKLELFTAEKVDHRGFGYALGAAVIAEDELNSGERHLRVDARYLRGHREPA